MRLPKVLAACLLAAAAPGASAAAVVTVVDGAPNVGMYTSLALNDGNPVVSYYDPGNGDLKLATCTGGCLGPAPTWVVTTIDSAGNVGWYTSLQLNGGNPVVSYYDVTRGALKLSTCTAGCATATPSWVITTVDSSSVDTGRFPSLQLNGGNPVIAYRDKANGDLKLATCSAACASATPAWTIATVDSAGDVGRFTSMQLKDGRPVIAYFDFSRGAVKVATCTDRCDTATAAWTIAVVDTVPGDIEVELSLQLNDGAPVVSYYDAQNGDLKLATCTGACASAAASWVVTTVDRNGDAGEYSSLQLVGGRPVVAYVGTLFNCTTGVSAISCHTATDLRLATCIAACASAAPTWVITTLDNGGLAGYDPSLRVNGGRAVVSYQDFQNGHLKLAVADLAGASVPSNYTGLWWTFDQAGWGINFNHQGDIVFATLFTYDSAGSPMWLVMPAGMRGAGDAFSGTLYRTTGPAFNADPFTPIGPANVVPVGVMTVEFAGDSASLNYRVDGAIVGKTIRKQVFGASAATCVATSADRGSLANYQDLWWNAGESGWGVNFTQQSDVIFATLFTYDAQGRATWWVAPDLTKRADGSFAGELYSTRGPAFNAAPWTPIGPADVSQVGNMQLRFSDGAHGTMTYSVDGVSVLKSITREVFASPVPACSG